MRVNGVAAAGAAALVAAALLASLGFASSLPTATRKLGANSAAVGGVTILQNLTGTNVVSVTVGGIASTCGGATLSLTLNNGLTSSSGSGVVPAAGGSMTVALAAAVAVRDSARIDVVIPGP